MIIVHGLALEPPVLRDLPDCDVLKFVDEPLATDLPNNTQFLERLVQAATSVGKAAADSHQRHGTLKAKLEMRQLYPLSATKKDFARLD